MKVFYSFAEAEGQVNNAVVTIGMFDGVHKGHKTIINHVIDIASEVGGEATLVTFWPHPRQVLAKDGTDLRLINTLDEKIDLLRQTGLQNLVIHPFSIEFSRTSSNDFLQNYIANTLNAKAIVVGKNHFFGHNREGSFEQIREFANTFSIVARQIPLKLIDEETISSAKIRESLTAGNIRRASELLGYDYFVSGTLSAAMQNGWFGFIPQQDFKLLPASGEYHGIISNGEQDIKCFLKIEKIQNNQSHIWVNLQGNFVSSGSDRIFRLTFL